MKIIVLVGPSASGKTTFIEILNEHYGLENWKTYSTRSPRSMNESDRICISEEEFVLKIKQDYFLEFIAHSGNFYGTPVPDRSVILNLDPVGMGAVRKYCKTHDVDFLSVYIDLPEEIRKERMLARWDSLEFVEKRMHQEKYYDSFKKASDIIFSYKDMSLEEGKNALVKIIWSSL